MLYNLFLTEFSLQMEGTFKASRLLVMVHGYIALLYCIVILITDPPGLRTQTHLAAQLPASLPSGGSNLRPELQQAHQQTADCLTATHSGPAIIARWVFGQTLKSYNHPHILCIFFIDQWPQNSAS